MVNLSCIIVLPLGSRKGEHKVCAFYFLVGNLETKYWSLLSNIHLSMLCKYKHVKNIGYKKYWNLS